MSKKRECEDCGEPAARETLDGVWLCEDDYQHLCDAAFADSYDEFSLSNTQGGEG